MRRCTWSCLFTFEVPGQGSRWEALFPLCNILFHFWREEQKGRDTGRGFQGKVRGEEREKEIVEREGENTQLFKERG